MHAGKMELDEFKRIYFVEWFHRTFPALETFSVHGHETVARADYLTDVKSVEFLQVSPLLSPATLSAAKRNVGSHRWASFRWSTGLLRW